MDGVEMIGYVAGTLTTVAFVPQVLRTVRTRRTEDLSLGMFLMFCAGVVVWLLYGILIASLPVILTNACVMVLAGTILVFKLRAVVQGGA